MTDADIAVLCFWICVLLFAIARVIFHTRFNEYTWHYIALGILLPFFILFSVLGAQSHKAYLTVYLVAIGFGVFFLWSIYRLLRFNPRGLPRWQRTIGAIFGLGMGLGVIYWGASTMIGDYALDREQLDGVITRAGTYKAKHRPRDYWVEIDGRRVYVLEQIHRTLRAGQRVRAEIGKGSNTAFVIESSARARR